MKLGEGFSDLSWYSTLQLRAVKLTLVTAVLALVSIRSVVAASPEPDALVEKLHDASAEVRIDALRQVQTTLDPRLPKEMLRLLSDQGDSIRRLAARGIGSRYGQIPKEELGDYLPPLRKLLVDREQHEDVALMAERAIGLLTRNYSGDLFAPSPDRKWIIYERYSRPCVIDVRRKNEELLGWRSDTPTMGFGSSWGGCTLKDSAFWHSGSRAVALQIILGRKNTTLWFWIPEGHSKLVELNQKKIASLFGAKNFDDSDYLCVSGRGWKGNEFVFEVESSKGGGKAAWNLKNGSLRHISED
jgi:hypothetical protein